MCSSWVTGDFRGGRGADGGLAVLDHLYDTLDAGQVRGREHEEHEEADAAADPAPPAAST